MRTAITYIYIALEKHQHDAIGSRAQKSERFTMRNPFILDYIYQTTGKSRTKKQVGSQLQQPPSCARICFAIPGKQFLLQLTYISYFIVSFLSAISQQTATTTEADDEAAMLAAFEANFS